MSRSPLDTISLHRRASTDTGSATSSADLPSDFVASSARRLVSFVGVVAFAYVLMNVLYMTIWSENAILIGRVMTALVVVDSLFVAWYLTRCARSTRTIAWLGIGYEILVCLSITVTEYWRIEVLEMPGNMVSWTCVVILVFPLLVPGSPRRQLLGSLLAATMNPLGLFLVGPLRGQAMPAFEDLFAFFLPPYLCALAAGYAAHVLNRMGREVRRARALGSYHLVERLGRGGMGEVWRAEHRMLIRPAAVKLIRPDSLGATDTDAAHQLRKRFELEAQATAALESPHTVELYDFGVADDGTFYYAMELLRGIDLETLVERFGPLDPERVVHLLLQVCDSLDDAHRRGLIHRDIKPANLFLSRRGWRFDFLRVLDFGLVKAQAAYGSDFTGPRATAAGEVRGTPAYIAPEMATEGQLDARADLYAVGCVAYWLLTGHLVFEGDSALKLVIAHASVPPEPPSRLTELPIPEDLEAVVMDCLQKRPDDRPASARVLAQRLAACGCAHVWDDARAERWWRAHLPELAGDDSLALDARAA